MIAALMIAMHKEKGKVINGKKKTIP